MGKKTVVILLIIFSFVSLFLHLYKKGEVPPCLNADEAAFGYNAYSILKTGRDEYGKLLPLRLKSFLDYKLPLYGYFSVPFIGLLGLNDFSVRFLNLILGVSLVPLMYFLTKELFKNEKIALVASFLTSLSPWIYILSRHAHEGVLQAFFTLLSLIFLIKYSKESGLVNFLLTDLFIFLAAFSYHPGRFFLIFVLLCQAAILYQSRKKISPKARVLKIIVILLSLTTPFLVDLSYGVNRVNNLLFFKDTGFTLRINEYLGEHPLRLFHNKLTESVRDVTVRYFQQLSPEFFLSSGDGNTRFTFQNLGLITPIEYVFLFVGLYYLFKNKEKYRYLIFSLILIAPAGNALTWQDYSFVRVYFLIFPMIFCFSYGIFHFILSIKSDRWQFLATLFIALSLVFYLINNWDIYFFHYPKRAVVVKSWQCGYRQLATYIKENYDRFKEFRITKRNGEPYIFLLFYLTYPPEKYQKQATMSPPDEFGYGQVEKFDKFNFNLSFDLDQKGIAYIGYPEHFADKEIDQQKIKKITAGTEEIFWIYEGI